MIHLEQHGVTLQLRRCLCMEDYIEQTPVLTIYPIYLMTQKVTTLAHLLKACLTVWA